MGMQDRVIMVDENARIIDGDTILAICARDMMKQGRLKNKKCPSTVMANFGFIKAMKGWGWGWSV